MSAVDALPPGGVDIDVVIVTWQGRALLVSCLEHLSRRTVPHRVIVADNASTDGTVELLRHEYPEVVVVALDENLGFGKANNLGVAAGNAPYVVLVNNDVDAAPDFLERAVAPLRTDPGVGAVAALTTHPHTGRVDQFGVALDRGLCAYARCNDQDPDALDLQPLAAPCAGAAAYRRTAFEDVGGFDEALFAYSEDLDLGLRLHDAGWQFADASDARGVHLGGATAGVGSPFQRRLASFGRGFIVGRYRATGLRGRLHGLAVDAAVIAAGLVRYRSVAPLTERVRGYRAARRTPRRSIDEHLIDEAVAAVAALRRLA